MDRFPLSRFALLSLAVLALAATTSAAKRNEKAGKMLSMFQVVQFPNEPCGGNVGKNGTCYTESECSDKGGSSSGSCASGYGVCCVFNEQCGGMTNENVTYFASKGQETGSCTLKICKCEENVCQLRLDFNTFVIGGPSTDTVTKTELLGGQTPLLAGKGLAMSDEGQCMTDVFSVTNPGGVAPPRICGTNSGEHMYVDASEACNNLNFALGMSNSAIGRQWNIKITQYACNYDNLAPEGCTQYYFGQASATVMTYNFQGGTHLANQNQNICVRAERGNCRICWTAQADTDFKVSFKSAKNFATKMNCCGYGSDGKKASGFDCVVIPGALTASKNTKVGGMHVCGRSMGLGSFSSKGMMTKGPKTICTDRQPFAIRFLSDSGEEAEESKKLMNTGFKLTYIQTATGC